MSLPGILVAVLMTAASSENQSTSMDWKPISKRSEAHVCSMLDEANMTKRGVDGYSKQAIIDELTSRGGSTGCASAASSIETVCALMASGIGQPANGANLCSYRDRRLESESTHQLCISESMSEISGKEDSVLSVGWVPIGSVLYELERRNEDCEPRSAYMMAAKSKLDSEEIAKNAREIALQRQQLAEIQKQQEMRNLQTTLQDVQRDMQDARRRIESQSDQYEPPRINQYSPATPQIVHCRTIGYITYCN